MTLNQALAIRIRELLNENKMSQYKLEQDTGLYHSTMNAILNNRVKASNFKSIALIVQALNMKFTDFFNSPVFEFDNLEIE